MRDAKEDNCCPKADVRGSVGCAPREVLRIRRPREKASYVSQDRPCHVHISWYRLEGLPRGPPAEAVPAIWRAISEAAPGVALASAAPFETFLDGPLAQPRLNALLLAVFAGAAVALTAVGLFGVMATMVRQRTRELGIRLALGAAPRDLWHMVMRWGLAIGATGLLLGLFGALLANHLLVV